jgi:hypothetical protein
MNRLPGSVQCTRSTEPARLQWTHTHTHDTHTHTHTTIHTGQTKKRSVCTFIASKDVGRRGRTCRPVQGSAPVPCLPRGRRFSDEREAKNMTGEGEWPHWTARLEEERRRREARTISCGRDMARTSRYFRSLDTSAQNKRSPSGNPSLHQQNY